MTESRVWKRARLVAPGQQVLGFQTSYQSSSERFSSFGKVEGLGARYSRALTWRELLAAEGSMSARAEMEDYMRSNGARPGDIAATANYDLAFEDLGFSIEWAYGLTKRWTIGFEAPLNLRTTRVSSRVSVAPALARGKSRVAQAQQENAIGPRVKAAAEQELLRDGYDGIPDEQQEWTWGDISLLSQFYLVNGQSWTWALQQLVRFPSSRNPSVSDYFQQASDDGQMDFGLSSLMDLRLRRWTLGARLGYVVQMPDAATMRVNGNSSTTIDSEIRRDLGDWGWAAVDAEYRVTTRLATTIEQTYLAKREDHYAGDMLSTADYKTLSRDTSQELYQTRVGVQYKVGESSQRSGVEHKWVTSLGYTYPWLGRNSLDAARASLEIINYF